MKAKSYVLWLVLGFGFLGVAFIYATTRSAEVLGSFLGERWDGKLGSESSLEEADVAVINVDGIILDSDEWMRKFQKAAKSDVPAIVVRIDSPGGAVAPSQEMYQAVFNARENKKVYCSLGDVAASGGYYIASACEKIFTNAGTITGSIGVIMSFMNLKDLYAWAKVQPYTIKAGYFKDVGNSARDMRDEERALLQRMIDDVHKQFRKDVAKGRGGKLPSESIIQYTDGRVFTGEQSVEYGFTDQVGTLQDTYDSLKAELGLERDLKIHNLDKKLRPIESLFEERSQSSFVGEIAGQLIQRFAPTVNSQKMELEGGKPYLLPYHWFDNPEGGLTR